MINNKFFKNSNKLVIEDTSDLNKRCLPNIAFLGEILLIQSLMKSEYNVTRKSRCVQMVTGKRGLLPCHTSLFRENTEGSAATII